MSSILFARGDILNQLDVCARESRFPILDHGYVYLADTRLSAYGDATRWALLIEVLGVDVRWGEHESIENRIYCYGNCLHQPPGTASNNVLHPTTDGPDRPTFTEEDVLRVCSDARTIRIRGNIVPISTDPVVLTDKGILLVNPPHVLAPDLLRSLVPTYRDWLFATEEELRERVPADLPLLLRLDAWHHPDLMEDEVPSETETFQMLADMIVANEPSLYHPRTMPNTHWTHWPHGGTL